MIKIILTQKEYSKNPNTKTTYIFEGEEVREISEKEHDLITNEETQKYFRRLRGTETANYGYTCNGYKVTKLTSTNPDKTTKIVRTFKFINLEN